VRGGGKSFGRPAAVAKGRPNGGGMSSWDVMMVIARRWYVVLAGLLVTAVAAAGAFAAAPVTYHANSSLLLLTKSTVSGVKTPSNPFLGFGTALAATGQVLGQIVESAPVQDKLLRRGATGAYRVVFASSGEAPLLEVEVTAPTADEAVRTLAVVDEETAAQLVTIQAEAGAPKGSEITLRTVTEDSVATLDRGDKVRALAAAGALGLFLSLILVFALEGVARGRTARHPHRRMLEDELSDHEAPRSHSGLPRYAEQPVHTGATHATGQASRLRDDRML